MFDDILTPYDNENKKLQDDNHDGCMMYSEFCPTSCDDCQYSEKTKYEPFWYNIYI
jgi:hypothetical protein